MNARRPSNLFPDGADIEEDEAPPPLVPRRMESKKQAEPPALRPRDTVSPPALPARHAAAAQPVKKPSLPIPAPRLPSHSRSGPAPPLPPSTHPRNTAPPQPVQTPPGHAQPGPPLPRMRPTSSRRHNAPPALPSSTRPPARSSMIAAQPRNDPVVSVALLENADDQSEEQLVLSDALDACSEALYACERKDREKRNSSPGHIDEGGSVSSVETTPAKAQTDAAKQDEEEEEEDDTYEKLRLDEGDDNSDTSRQARFNGAADATAATTAAATTTLDGKGDGGPVARPRPRPVPAPRPPTVRMSTIAYEQFDDDSDEDDEENAASPDNKDERRKAKDDSVAATATDKDTVMNGAVSPTTRTPLVAPVGTASSSSSSSLLPQFTAVAPPVPAKKKKGPPPPIRTVPMQVQFKTSTGVSHPHATDDNFIDRPAKPPRVRTKSACGFDDEELFPFPSANAKPTIKRNKSEPRLSANLVKPIPRPKPEPKPRSNRSNQSQMIIPPRRPSEAERLAERAKSPAEAQVSSQVDVCLDRRVANVPAGMSITQTTCAGHLFKLGGKRKNWKWRYFVLDVVRKQVTYFEDETRQACKGAIPLHEVTDVSVMPLSKEKFNGFYYFQMVTPKRIYQMRSEEEPPILTWVTVLLAALGRTDLLLHAI